jgi:hypothetical protein
MTYVIGSLLRMLLLHMAIQQTEKRRVMQVAERKRVQP